MKETMTRLGVGKHIVSAEYFIALQEFAWERGMEPQAFIRDTGLPLSVLIQPNLYISASAMQQGIRNLINEFDSPELSIEYGRRLSISDHGALGIASQSSKNLYATAELLIQFINTRSTHSDAIDFEVKGGRAYIIVRIENSGDFAALRFYALSLLVTIETGIRIITGSTLEDINSEILISFDSPGVIASRYLPTGLKLKFNQDVNEISIPVELMQRPLKKFNPEMASIAASACEEELDKLGFTKNITATVRSVLRKTDGRLPTINCVSDSLNVSARTLKRKLSNAGTSYQKIKDSERFRKAIYLLEFTDETMEKIAENLGYSDASSFNKAFKSWAGVTPSDYRNFHQMG
jgi:AraC-like DNA-binding protein